MKSVGIVCEYNPFHNGHLYHINEIKKCSEDLFYFVKNYCKILTKSGIEFPEFREYQIDFLKELKTGDDIIASLPRQCVVGDTEIVVNNSKTTIKELFNEAKVDKLSKVW